MTTPTEPAFGLKPTTPAEVAKAIVYIALGAVTILASVLTDGELTTFELIQVAIVVVGLIPVYLLTGTATKTAAAFVVALLQGAAALIASGLGLGDIGPGAWLAVVVGAFAAIGIAVVPNAPPIAYAELDATAATWPPEPTER